MREGPRIPDLIGICKRTRRCCKVASAAFSAPRTSCLVWREHPTTKTWTRTINVCTRVVQTVKTLNPVPHIRIPS